jgi:hypothetical protein
VIFLLVAGLSIGIEGGTDLPVSGFEDLNSGAVFRVFAGKHAGPININIAFESTYHAGENPGYGVTDYGLRLVLGKSGWRFSPLAELGLDHISRTINNSSENGTVLSYAAGFLIAFKAGSIQIFPKFYYAGLTDSRRHAGFLGMKLGIGYEFGQATAETNED